MSRVYFAQIHAACDCREGAIQPGCPKHDPQESTTERRSRNSDSEAAQTNREKGSS